MAYGHPSDVGQQFTCGAARQCSGVVPLPAIAHRRANVNDMWIAATALALGVPVVTQDQNFDVIAELTGLEVVHV